MIYPTSWTDLGMNWESEKHVKLAPYDPYIVAVYLAIIERRNSTRIPGITVPASLQEVLPTWIMDEKVSLSHKEIGFINRIQEYMTEVIPYYLNPSTFVEWDEASILAAIGAESRIPVEQYRTSEWLFQQYELLNKMYIVNVETLDSLSHEQPGKFVSVSYDSDNTPVGVEYPVTGWKQEMRWASSENPVDEQSLSYETGVMTLTADSDEFRNIWFYGGTCEKITITLTGALSSSFNGTDIDSIYDVYSGNLADFLHDRYINGYYYLNEIYASTYGIIEWDLDAIYIRPPRETGQSISLGATFINREVINRINNYNSFDFQKVIE